MISELVDTLREIPLGFGAYARITGDTAVLAMHRAKERHLHLEVMRDSVISSLAYAFDGRDEYPD